MPVRTILLGITRLTGLPTLLLNDVRSITNGEWRFGAGRGVDTLAVFAIGLAALVYVMARPAAPSAVKIRIEGRSAVVELGEREAVPGKLDYGFDFDGDGREDRLGPIPSATWSYARPGRYRLHIRITDPQWSTTRTIERTIDIR